MRAGRPAAVLAAVLLMWAARAHAVEQLVPLAAGNKWEYSVTETGVMTFDSETDTRSAKTSSEGTCVETVALAKGEGPSGVDAYLSTTATKMKAGLNTQAKESAVESLLLATSTGIEMTATRASGLRGALTGEWQRYVPPLLMYRADARPGMNWEVGTMREGELTIPLQASVIRAEDVTVPAGEFKDCLKLCVSSREITGTMTIGKTKLAIKHGEQLNMIWIAKGVGVVKEDGIFRIVVDLPASEGAQAVTATSTKRKIKELLPGYKIK